MMVVHLVKNGFRLVTSLKLIQKFNFEHFLNLINIRIRHVISESLKSRNLHSLVQLKSEQRIQD